MEGATNVLGLIECLACGEMVILIYEFANGGFVPWQRRCYLLKSSKLAPSRLSSNTMAATRFLM